MKYLKLLTFFTVFLCAVSISTLFAGIQSQKGEAQPISSKEYIDHELLLKLSDDQFKKQDLSKAKSNLKTLLSSKKLTLIEYFQPINWVHVKLNNENIDNALKRLRSDKDFSYAEPNYIQYSTNLEPRDPRFIDQWHHHQDNDADMDSPEAWAIQTGSNQVIVAVVDSGVDYTHEDLRDNMWNGENCQDYNRRVINGGCPNHGWDFSQENSHPELHGDNNPLDVHGHGSHVAGIIGARGDNNIGLSGVNWNIQIMALKGGELGSFPADNTIKAYMFAAHNGARVINASLGGSQFSQANMDAIEYFLDFSDGVFVAAAGNNARNIDNSLFYPACYDLNGIISVGSTDVNDEISWFSNFGIENVDVFAPGSNILSTYPDYTDNLVLELSIRNRNEIPEEITLNDWTIGNYSNRFDPNQTPLSFDNTMNDEDRNEFIELISTSLIPDSFLPYRPDHESNLEISFENINFDGTQESISHLNFYIACDTEIRGDRAGLADYVAAYFSNDGENYEYKGSIDEKTIDRDGDFNDNIKVSKISLPIPFIYRNSNSSFKLKWATNEADHGTSGAGCMVNGIKITHRSSQPSQIYTSMGGTSMAAPQVAGLAGLLLAEAPILTGNELKSIIMDSGDQIEALIPKSKSGKRINLHQSIINARNFVQPIEICGQQRVGIIEPTFCDADMELNDTRFWAKDHEDTLLEKSDKFKQGRQSLFFQTPEGPNGSQLHSIKQSGVYFPSNKRIKISYWYSINKGPAISSIETGRKNYYNFLYTKNSVDQDDNNLQIRFGIPQVNDIRDLFADPHGRFLNGVYWRKVEQIIDTDDHQNSFYTFKITAPKTSLYIDDFKLEEIEETPNYIIDSNFSLAGLAHWYQLAPSPYKEKRITKKKENDNYFLLISPELDQRVRIKQNFNKDLSPNTLYSLRFKAKRLNNQLGSLTFRIIQNNRNVISEYTVQALEISNLDWSEFTHDFISDMGSGSYHLEIESDGLKVNIDDIVLISAPSEVNLILENNELAYSIFRENTNLTRFELSVEGNEIVCLDSAKIKLAMIHDHLLNEESYQTPENLNYLRNVSEIHIKAGRNTPALLSFFGERGENNEYILSDAGAGFDRTCFAPGNHSLGIFMNISDDFPFETRPYLIQAKLKLTLNQPEINYRHTLNEVETPTKTIQYQNEASIYLTNPQDIMGSFYNYRLSVWHLQENTCIEDIRIRVGAKVENENFSLDDFSSEITESILPHIPFLSSSVRVNNQQIGSSRIIGDITQEGLVIPINQCVDDQVIITVRVLKQSRFDSDLFINTGLDFTYYSDSDPEVKRSFTSFHSSRPYENLNIFVE